MRGAENDASGRGPGGGSRDREGVLVNWGPSKRSLTFGARMGLHVRPLLCRTPPHYDEFEAEARERLGQRDPDDWPIPAPQSQHRPPFAMRYSWACLTLGRLRRPRTCSFSTPNP